MAGNYPDALGSRFMYDLDGSLGFLFYSDGSNGRQMTAQELTDMNSGASDNAFPGGANQPHICGLIFPSLRDITGILTTESFNQNYDFQVSNNTTNGLDGTWTTIRAAGIPYGDNGTFLRTGATAAAASGVKAIRFFNAMSVGTFWVFGKVTTPQALHQVRLWHPSLDQALDVTPAFLDWGDTARSTTETRQFRVKNVSTTKTATNTVVSQNTSKIVTPDIVQQFALSTDDVTYAPSFTIASLVPGALGGPYYVRRTIAADSALGLYYLRLVASPGSMT